MNYLDRVIKKPWGEEYIIFNYGNNVGITYLKIKKNYSTSLHCHPKKKTGFLILEGTAEVQVGIYKKNIRKYRPMSILVLRPGLFHKIKASKNSDLYALEIENPFMKNDLVRMKDAYGRDKKGYESLKYSRKFSKEDIKFSIPKLNEKNKYKLNGTNIEISHFKNFKNFKLYDDKSICIILDGKMISENNKTVISAGEIVKSFTLKRLNDFFSIDRKILILKAKKIRVRKKNKI